MSSALDEDTRASIAQGRETLGAMLRSAQKDLQKVFVVFVVGFMGTFYALRLYVWDFLKAVTKARLDAQTEGEVEIIAQTPFDVILLQAKIGLVVGIVVAVPPLLYFSREALRLRGWWPDAPVSRWKLAGIVLLAAGLFVVGVVYGYSVFFPFMFAFLANNALSAGIQPTYSIVKWAQFIALLTFSFGFAAQMPLLVTALSYAEIVPYETFREKWRHAVALIFVFGAFFSPPDPFTQIMWALPLIFLYGASLYLAKVVVTARRGGESVSVPATARGAWNRIAAAAVLGGGATYLFFAQGGASAVNGVLASTDLTSAQLPVFVGVPLAAVTGGVALAGAVVALAAALYAELDDAAGSQAFGDPTAIDLDELDEAGVRAAPEEAFADLSEEAALAAAERAIEAGAKPKARAILDRHDAATAADDESAEGTASGGDGTGSTGSAAGGGSTGGGAAATSGPARDLFAADVGTLGAIRRGAGFVDWGSRLRALWNVLLGVAVAVFGVGYALVERPELSSEVLAVVGLARPDVPALLGLSATATLAAFAATGLVVAGLFGGVIALTAAYLAGTDPTAVDVTALSRAELERAPTATFAALSERRVNYLADELAETDRERARVLLDRADEARAAVASGEAAPDAPDAGDLPGVADDTGDRVSRAGGAFLSDLTDGEQDEDDIGGYYDDLAFVLDSMRGGLFRIVAVFGLVMVGTFAWLYSGGIGDLRQNFVDRLPTEVVGPGAENFGVIVLHPVEALIFEVKFSTLIGVAAALPVAAYYAWPALRDRGFVRGRRQVIFGWVAALLVGLVGGFVLGYTTIAPAIISWLVADVLSANMVVSYRISNFFWLIVFTTFGIGILVDVPVAMLLLNSAGVSYQAMRKRWREVTVGLMVVAALFTPADIITMMLVTVPLMAMYGVGLLVLFFVTLGGRRNLAEPTFAGDDDDPVVEG
ncbi:twin-arginine translocase subunit TatC [Halobaculum sp. MBLA0147]|uniref:twin-arginine translocase subunit TatC n=1 Tax=Halobaculum sp. MBLA0147 TaxID=3079934 RepID=UPI0035238734